MKNLKISSRESTGNKMPAIQVYKLGSTMIPVEQSKTAKAYICPWTKKIYATKRGYVKHLKTLRTNRIHARYRRLRHQRKLEDMRNQPNFDSVINWIHLNPEVFWENAKQYEWTSDAARWDKIRDSFTVTIQHLSLIYSDRVSNTHDCPLNGVTNWSGRDTFEDGTIKPRGYPGFNGTIIFKTSHEPLSFSSNIFKGTGINTGSGGGGNNIYRFSVRMFLDDWPGIAKTIQAAKEQHERDHFLDMIKNEYTPYRVPTFAFGKGLY
jgi:hypothetical protein